METIQYQPNNNKPVSTIKKSMGTDGVAPPDVSQMSADKLDKKAVMKVSAYVCIYKIYEIYSNISIYRISFEYNIINIIIYSFKSGFGVIKIINL